MMKNENSSWNFLLYSMLSRTDDQLTENCIFIYKSRKTEYRTFLHSFEEW